MLHHSRKDAMRYPKGDIELAFCQSCGFVTNIAFDSNFIDYNIDYESTQVFSPTFNSFQNALGKSLVERYDLNRKTLIEIGCGQGEFLTLICDLGDNSGIGFDPAYRGTYPGEKDITFISDFYSEKYASYKGDFVCCKMTLEHIPKVKEFVTTIFNAIRDQPDSVVFFQIPNARYVFEELAFWDVYYEHCSYFTPGSLVRLFGSVGFEVLDLWTGYDNQYLMMEMRPTGRRITHHLSQDQYIWDVFQIIKTFAKVVPEKIQSWRQWIHKTIKNGSKVVLWGGGSKAVAFLTAIGISFETIDFVVDVNPQKENTFLAGTGQQVVFPSFLLNYEPSHVIIMNPIYREEIQACLNRMDLHPILMTVSDI
jgi:hypothetical protein